MSDNEEQIGHIISDLKSIFRDAAASSYGPAQAAFNHMARNALLGLDAAEMQFQQGLIAHSVETTRFAVKLALDDEGKILKAASGDERIHMLFDEMAEKTITKTVGILNYGIDILAENRDEMAQIRALRRHARLSHQPKN